MMNHFFNISGIDASRAEGIALMPCESHVHDFEELIVGLKGKPENFVDFKTSVAEAPLVIFIAIGKIHLIITKLQNGHFDMRTLRFKNEFIAKTTFQLFNCFHDNSNQVFQTGACFSRLSAACEILDQEMKEPTKTTGKMKKPGLVLAEKSTVRTGA